MGSVSGLAANFVKANKSGLTGNQPLGAISHGEGRTAPGICTSYLRVPQVSHPWVTNVLPLPRNTHSFSTALTVSLLVVASVLKYCCLVGLALSFGFTSPCSAWPLGELFMFSFLLCLPEPCFFTIFHILVHPALDITLVSCWFWFIFSFCFFINP